MPTRVKIKLKKDHAIITPATEDTPEIIDYIPQMQKFAEEVLIMNSFVDGEGGKFPRPIKANPTAVVWVEEKTVDVEIIPAHYEGQVENFVGLNTPPTQEGYVHILLSDYTEFDLAILDVIPAKPSTFSVCYTENIGGFVE